MQQAEVFGPVFEAVTDAIHVGVRTQFIPEQSDPEDNVYVWAYHISITNQSDRTVQLLNRYWHITDANGSIQEVRGEGVVGEKPVIEPGGAYYYVSGTPLATSSGFMRGSYEMLGPEGKLFDVTIPTFSLDLPEAEAVFN